jgi:hypothetical protein
MQAPRTDGVTLQELMQRPPAAILAWVTQVRLATEPEPAGFNWLGLVEKTTLYAHLRAAKVTRRLDQFAPEQQRLLRLVILSRRTMDAEWIAQLAARQQASEVALSERAPWLLATLDVLAFADIAIAAYGYLIGHGALRERDLYLDAMMQLRAALIIKIGVVPGDEVLDAAALVYRFFDHLRLTPERALEKSRHLQASDARESAKARLHDLRTLRRLKHRLSPIALLVESGQVQPTAALQAWLSIREQLP